MQLNIKEQLKLHNRYEFELTDARTGEVKQRAIAENVVLNQMWNVLGGGQTLQMFYGIRMGTGSGTPAVTDTNLFTTAFTYSGNSYFTQVSRNEAYPTCTYTYKISIPATSSYTGALTEVGLVAYSSTLWTHAMLEDSEGNPITINKTDLDVLTVTVTIYVTFGTTSNNFHWYVPGPRNNICRLFRSVTGALPFYGNALRLCHCTSISLDDNGCIIGVTSASAMRLGSGSYSAANKTITINTVRMGTAVGNTNYYNGLVMGNQTAYSQGEGYFGGIVYPDSDIFPDYTISGMNVGTGDGTTTNFDIPIEYFIADTDVVKVNNVALTRGTDYTIDNVNEALVLDDSIALSAFLEPIANESDIQAPDDSARTSRILFTQIRAPFEESFINSAYSKIFKVSDSCACNKLSHIKLINYPLFYTEVSAYAAPDTTTTMRVNELEAGLTLPILDSNDVPAFISAVAATPDAFPSCSVDGGYIQAIRVDSNISERIAQNTDDTVYYAQYDTAHLLWASTTCSDIPVRRSSFSDTITYDAVVTSVIDGVTWYGGLMYVHWSLFNSPGILFEHAYALDMLDGCSLDISVGQSATGPWTLLKSWDLSTLTQLTNGTPYPRRTYYGISGDDFVCNTCACGYIKIDLNTANATRAEYRLETSQLLLSAPAAVDSYSVDVLGYVGGGITFATAPAAGSTITLDAAIDRPFKNANFVIDAAMTLQFGGA